MQAKIISIKHADERRILHYRAVLQLKCKIIIITRKGCTGQVLPSAKYRPTHLVVDAALRCIGRSRYGGHKIENISRSCERI